MSSSRSAVLLATALALIAGLVAWLAFGRTPEPEPGTSAPPVTAAPANANPGGAHGTRISTELELPGEGPVASKEPAPVVRVDPAPGAAPDPLATKYSVKSPEQMQVTHQALCKQMHELVATILNDRFARGSYKTFVVAEGEEPARPEETVAYQTRTHPLGDGTVEVKRAELDLENDPQTSELFREIRYLADRLLKLR